jgi:hypothetical protein
MTSHPADPIVVALRLALAEIAERRVAISVVQAGRARHAEESVGVDSDIPVMDSEAPGASHGDAGLEQMGGPEAAGRL